MDPRELCEAVARGAPDPQSAFNACLRSLPSARRLSQSQTEREIEQAEASGELSPFEAGLARGALEAQHPGPATPATSSCPISCSYCGTRDTECHARCQSCGAPLPAPAPEVERPLFGPGPSTVNPEHVPFPEGPSSISRARDFLPEASDIGDEFVVVDGWERRAYDAHGRLPDSIVGPGVSPEVAKQYKRLIKDYYALAQAAGGLAPGPLIGYNDPCSRGWRRELADVQEKAAQSEQSMRAMRVLLSSLPDDAVTPEDRATWLAAADDDLSASLGVQRRVSNLQQYQSRACPTR